MADDRESDGRFKSGNSMSFAKHPDHRNAGGRPKGRSLQAQLHRMIDDELKGEELCNALVRAALDRALKGDFRFWQEIINRIDGKVAQSHEVDAGSLTFILDEAVQSSSNGRA